MNKTDSISRVLVTGASGFIGGKLSRRFVEQGVRVRCHYRRDVLPPNLKELEGLGAELFRMDLAPPISDSAVSKGNGNSRVSESAESTFSKDLAKLLSGVDLVYHFAALASDWGPRQEFERCNVEATSALLDAAIAAGVKRFVYISSVAVHGFGHHKNSTEDGPYYPPTHYYQETKKRAEEIALSKSSKNFEVSAIRPGNVYGPDDTTRHSCFPCSKE